MLFIIVRRHVILFFSFPKVFTVIVFLPTFASVYERGETKVIGISSQLIIHDKSYSCIFLFFS